MPTLTTREPVRHERVTSSSGPPRRSSRRAIFLVILAVVATLLLFGGIKAWQIVHLIHAGKATQPPPTTVTSALVQQADWQPTLSAVGSISPVQGATISAELAGRVAEINFDSGAQVQEGQPLLKLDTGAEEAQLRAAQADAELAKAELDRSQNLAKGNVISKAEFDTARAKYDAAKAAVDNMQAVIAKKAIRAPFTGTAGIRYVNPGQMVAVGDKLVSLQTLDRVFVDFSLPQNDLPKVSTGLEVHVRTDALPGREFKGMLNAINPGVDAATRSVQMQASLENKDHALRPGMFAKIEVLLPQKNTTLFIPATAVSYAPFGDSVFIIEKKQNQETKKEELALRQQFIRLGEARGDFVAVTEGLKKGQMIVSTGAFKLRNGMDVTIDNKLAPKPQLAPKPNNT